MEIEGVMQTPDGAWRVEVVRDRWTRWYRIVHGEAVFEGLALGTVMRILTDAGVALDNLTEVDPAA